jgi:hypothetical protein
MNTILSSQVAVETPAVESAESQKIVTDLSTIELALVGGGQGVPSFY